MSKKKTGTKKPGKQGESLNPDSNIYRFGVTQDRFDRVSTTIFNLSSVDRKIGKKSGWYRISAFSKEFTTLQQGLNILNKFRPKKRFAVELNVGELQNLEYLNKKMLDVKWDHSENCLKKNRERRKNADPGCEGHCAIDGCFRYDNKNINKEEAKELRLKMTDIANSPSSSIHFLLDVDE